MMVLGAQGVINGSALFRLVLLVRALSSGMTNLIFLLFSK
jgi:hypothetical protein